MAMTAPAVAVLPTLPSSYTTPLTPRAKASKITFEPTMAGITMPILATRIVSAPTTDVPSNGAQVEVEATGVDEQGVRTSLDSISDNDGRITPVPNPDATIRRSRPESPRAILPPRQHPLFSSSSSTQPAAAAAPAQTTIPAKVGLGTLHGEEQLKISLQSKDRIFVVMLSKEIEAFLQRCTAGEVMQDAQAVVSQAGGSALAIFGTFPTVKIQSAGTSKFQRMLVYKVAEWYGAKAVPGPENVIYLGLLGDIPEKSTSLKLVSLVPEREAVQQKFKIMQRSQPVGPSRSGSSADGGDGGPTSRKTLEQREAEYAAERERIYGATQQEAEEVLDRPTPRRVEDEIDPVSRYAYGTDYDPIYAPYTDIPPGQIDPTQHMNGGAAYYQAVPYPGYQMAPGYNGYAPGQPMYTQQAFDQHGNPIMLVAQQMNGYPMWQSQPMANGAMPPPMMPGQMPANGNGWAAYQQQMGMPQPNSNGSASMPPQIYGYPPYPSLVHPQPTRPQPQHHSSASSSISSHSYHSHQSPHSHTHSRPHSRGSTTSTRSAASSARFGQMYPGNVGYRQKAIKGGVNGLTTLGIAHDRRSTRGQSPSSTTTTSSRSSRRANSIVVPPPTQHPLPQRPDWAKDNVPYKQSSIPSTFLQPDISPNPDNSSEQGLHQNGSAYTPSNGSMSGWTTSPSSLAMDGQYPHGPQIEIPYRPRPSQALFDPSNPSSSRPTSSNGNRNMAAFSAMTPAGGQPYPSIPDGADMSPEDIIEAKLQALSFSTGMAIGPPPVRATPGPSYAKIVRRD